MFGIFIINLRIYRVKECALNMVLLSRLFLHLTDLTPMQRFYVVVGVLAVVVFLQFLVIIGMLWSNKKKDTGNENQTESQTQGPLDKKQTEPQTQGSLPQYDNKVNLEDEKNIDDDTKL